MINKEGFSEFKENEMKAKQGSIQRVTKSFMAPTISNKSPSTRKKFLSERNEMDEDESGSKFELWLDHNNLPLKPRNQPVEPDYVDVTEPTSTQPEPLEFSEPNTISIGSAEPSSSSYPATNLPPYDPKTNYLSPRPRFLYYKPRPRIEVFVQNEQGVDFVKGGKNLEESFSSGSCSDTETTDQTPSSEDGYSSELVSEEENQTNLDYTQRKRTCNSLSFLGSKIAPFLLVFVIACLSFQVSDTPVLPQSAYRVQTCSMDATAKIVESVIVNFKDLGSNLKHWSSHTISYLSMLMSAPNIVEDLGELQTYIKVTEHISTHEIVGVSEIEEQENLDLHAISEPVDTAIVWQSSDSDNSIHTQSAELGVATDTSELDNHILAESENIEQDVIPPTSEWDDPALTQSQNSGFLSENREMDDSDMDTTEGLELEDGLSQSPEFVSNGDLDNALPLGNLSAQNIGIMLSVVTVAAAAASYTYLERKKATTSKKTGLKSLSFIGDSGDPYRVSSPPKPSQVVMVDDSCFSEVSSRGPSNRGPSSSECSYGSFTTCVKIPRRHHGCGDYEVVTPVRQSSRRALCCFPRTVVRTISLSQ